MSGKIFIVGDDKAKQTLSMILLQENYGMESVSNEQEIIAALGAEDSEKAAVVLVDVECLGTDGIKLMREARKISPGSRFILLTEDGSLDGAVKALRNEAHDYFVKPVDPGELLQSIERAIALREKDRRVRQLIEQLETTVRELKKELEYFGEPRTRLQVIPLPAGVSYDRLRREMWRGSSRVYLTPTEGKLFEILVTNWGRLIENSELAFLIQGHKVDEAEAPEILRPLISRLRQKLKVFPQGEQWIMVVRGKGYVFDE